MLDALHVLHDVLLVFFKDFACEGNPRVGTRRRMAPGSGP